MKLRSFLFRLVRIQLVAALLLMLLSLFVVRRMLVRPITQLAVATRDFTLRQKDDTLAPAALDERSLRSDDEIGVLCRSVRQMEEDLSAYIKNLTAVTAEKERISTELDLARRIQESMLPCIFPPYPERKEFDVFASMELPKRWAAISTTSSSWTATIWRWSSRMYPAREFRRHCSWSSPRPC